MASMASNEMSARVEREIVKTFRRHGALSGTAALRLRDLGLSGNPVLKGLVTRAVIRRAGPERYYLHEPSWASESQMMAGLMGWVTLAIAVVSVAAVIYLSNRGH